MVNHLFVPIFIFIRVSTMNLYCYIAKAYIIFMSFGGALEFYDTASKKERKLNLNLVYLLDNARLYLSVSFVVYSKFLCSSISGQAIVVSCRRRTRAKVFQFFNWINYMCGFFFIILNHRLDDYYYSHAKVTIYTWQSVVAKFRNDKIKAHSVTFYFAFYQFYSY